LLREFASEYLNKSCYLTMEDMLYSPLVLKVRNLTDFCFFNGNQSTRLHNVMVFIAELFWWFETVKPEFVQPRDLQEFKDAIAHPKSARPSVPISNATKRSFLTSPGVADNQSSPEVCNRYFLHPEGSDPLPLSTLSPFMLHSGTDSDADIASGDSVSLARSISKDSLASNVINVTPKHQTAVHQSSFAAMRRVNGHNLLTNVNMEDGEETLAVARTDASVIPKRVDGTYVCAAVGPKPSSDSKPASDGFYLEPLMPAVLKTAKEKSVCLNKEEESGEVARSAGRGSLRCGDGSSAAVRRKAPSDLKQTFTPPGEEENLSEEPQHSDFRPVITSNVNYSSREPAEGFYLHVDSEEPMCVHGTEAELEDLDEEEEDLDEALTTKDSNHPRKAYSEADEEESAKLQEDMNVKEHEDKDFNGGSGRSSPCLSTHSQASSMASGSVRMTSFAERKAQQQRFGSNHDLRSSASSSQRTTPDGSESSGPLSSSWRLKRDQSPSSPLGGCTRPGDGGTNVLASEIVQLRMQLEEKRRAIEHQKKKMEVLAARQRQKLGKAAFLHIVKKGGGRSDTLPSSLKADISKEELNGERGPLSKDDMCVDTLRGEKEGEETGPPGALEGDKKGNGGSFYLDEELDLNECSRSIELLNDAIGSIQQQMMQLSLQQEMLMKQNVQSPPGAAPAPAGDKDGDSKTGGGFHFVEHLSGTSSAPTRKPPKLSSGRSSRSKPSELKIAKEHSRQASRTLTPSQGGSETLPNPRQLAGGRSPRAEQPGSPRIPIAAEIMDRPGSGHIRSATFRLHDEANMRLPTRVDLMSVSAPEPECLSSTQIEHELGSSEKDYDLLEEAQRSKTNLIEVDLSELKAPEEEEGAEDKTAEDGDGEQKSVMGFFFKVRQKIFLSFQFCFFLIMIS
ncbi:hypothetical protein XENOCAPTIV_009574, partial [Xenoophorus captivus]